MKRYQIALLVFAAAIFIGASLMAVLFVVKDKNSKNSIFSESGLDYDKYNVVKVFFSNNITDPETLYCDKTYPTERNISVIKGYDTSILGEIAYLALAELLSGPTQDEVKKGFFTSISKDAGIKRITIKDCVAMVDFNSELNKGFAGSCKVQAIRSQITETLKQFPGIEEVVISVEGEVEGVLEP